VRRAIISGDLHPGQRLREVALATELGVSRPTLREALRTLAQECLCEQEPHRGFAVARLDAGALHNAERARDVHGELRDAIRSRDPQRLEVALDEHTSRSAEEFISLGGE
jgi:DNA-binding GntR family transcriptional regulator